MFEDLCVGLSQPCVCSGRWKLHSTKQVGYCYDDQELSPLHSHVLYNLFCVCDYLITYV